VRKYLKKCWKVPNFGCKNSEERCGKYKKSGKWRNVPDFVTRAFQTSLLDSVTQLSFFGNFVKKNSVFFENLMKRFKNVRESYGKSVGKFQILVAKIVKKDAENTKKSGKWRNVPDESLNSVFSEIS
jgi:hypothetical protein